MADELDIPTIAWYRRKLVWAMMGVMVIGVVAGLGGWLMRGSEDTTGEQVVIDEQALYVSMSRPFIFSVAAGVRERLVQVEVQLMVRGAANLATAKRHLPLLESTLLTVFSRQGADNYLTAEGKLVVRQEAQNELNQVLAEELGERLVEQVLFTGIVMQ